MNRIAQPVVFPFSGRVDRLQTDFSEEISCVIFFHLFRFSSLDASRHSIDCFSLSTSMHFLAYI